MAHFTMDAGEYARIVADYSEETSPPWDDLTGASVTLVGKTSLSGSAVFTATGTLDAANADGKVKSCGAAVPLTAPAGDYHVTLTITKTGVDGWPQHHGGHLLIKAHA
jgi:hypothetical protein